MKRTIISVEKLKQVFAGEQPLRAYPVQSSYSPLQYGDEYGITKGFYLGVLPVYEQGYGLSSKYSGLYFRAKDTEDFPVKTEKGLYTLILDEDYLQFNGEYYLSPRHVNSRLLAFGFTEEQIEECKEEVDFPFAISSLDLTPEEAGILVQQMENIKEEHPSLFKKLESASKYRPLFRTLKSHLEKSS